VSEAHFLDTSALVKRYINEPGSERLLERTFANPDVEVMVSSLTYYEMYATFSRLLRDGDLTVAEHQAVLKSFERDWGSFVVVDLGPQVHSLVPELARAHNLRGADLCQLASAMYMHARRALDIFVACDVRLANAAIMIKLPLYNPESEP
jgi:uncharacterized protein